MDRLSSVYNYRPLSHLIATAGQPTAEQLGEIANQGYRVVVNLALPTSDHALPNEKELVEALGMAYVAIPVVWDDPTLDDLEQFFQVMDANQGRRIFVHCAANMRVSVFMYLYRRVKTDMKNGAALGDLHEVWQPNSVWQDFMARSLAHYQR